MTTQQAKPMFMWKRRHGTLTVHQEGRQTYTAVFRSQDNKILVVPDLPTSYQAVSTACQLYHQLSKA